MQSMGVGSLNHDLTTSYRLDHTPFFQKFTPTCTMYYVIRVCPYAHPQLLKVLKHYAYICHGWRMQSLGVWSLNRDLTTSLGLSHAPIFRKIHPHPYRRNSVRVHPYAHPQHLKVLKHFVYFQYGCGMQSMGVCSLNHDLTTSYRLGHTPFSLKFTPTCTMYYGRHKKGVPIYPSTASQGAKTLCIYMPWLEDAVFGDLEPQP
jgi:hypothetical protein